MRRARPVLAVPALAVGLLLAGCGGGDDQAAEQPAAPSPGGTAAEGAGDSGVAEVASCRYEPSGQDPARPVGPPDAEDVVREGQTEAVLATGAGDVPLVLDDAAAPCTVASFRHLAQEGFFDGTECHRLTTQGIFVLQCGDPTATGTAGPGYRFADENTDGATYGRGTLAMANAGPDTNGSQFFLVYDESPLPPDYSVFGTVTEEGLAVLDGIAAAGAQGGGPDGPPATPVEISEVRIG